MKIAVYGIKNEWIQLRFSDQDSSSNQDSSLQDSMKLNSFNFIFFQEHLIISPIETSLIILSVFRNGYLSKSLFLWSFIAEWIGFMRTH